MNLHSISLLHIAIIQHIIFGLLLVVLLRKDYIQKREDIKMRFPAFYNSNVKFVKIPIKSLQNKYGWYYLLAMIFGFFGFIYYLIINKNVKI